MSGLCWLTTEARGNGLVGDFGNRLRAAFAAVSRGATEEPAFLVILGYPEDGWQPEPRAAIDVLDFLIER